MSNELKYGDRIHLQNGYNNWQGGYLDTNNHATTDQKNAGGKYDVCTNGCYNRSNSTVAGWKIHKAPA
ncbi:hypothetical protein OH768_14105 [Streptomyces sp. NBC_01622]|uniref:hypothetical protein n=1 Tax=Streptomyces sp. NBC_01622 TaxID=2975903 RepID=UPI00386BD71C|nr:hypothetical protein OH768_14105 [Streptomyces sp. NBC_01622]